TCAGCTSRNVGIDVGGGEMGSLTAVPFVSLDGVMQAPGEPGEDRSGGFEHGGWAYGYWDDAMQGIIAEQIETADAILLGRGTYQIFARYWPRVSGEDRVAAALNSAAKYVASASLDAVDWNNSKLLEGKVPEAVAALKAERGGEIQVHGSPGLLQT